MTSSNVVSAPADVVSAPADVVVVSSKAERIALFNETSRKVAEAVSAALSTCKSWQDFGALAASRFESQAGERAHFMAHAKARGVDFADDPAKVTKEVRDAIVAGFVDHYVSTEPAVRYKRGDNGALLVMDELDFRGADVRIAATEACVSHKVYAALQKTDAPKWKALTAFRKRIDCRARVRYHDLFKMARAQAKVDQVEALYNPDGDVRDAAEKAAAANSATRSKAKPIQIEGLAALIDNVIDLIDAAKTAKTIKAPLAQAVADLLIEARKATGVEPKAE